MKSLWKTFKQGIIYENPLLMLMIGLCSALAVTSSVNNAIGMGLAMTFVLLFSEIFISLFRKAIPSSARMPIFIIIIAAFTTMVDLVMKAYFPELSKSMGVFIPLIVVNCIIIARAEAFAAKNGVLASIIDGLGMGLGYTVVLLALAVIREALSAGTVFGVPFSNNFEPVLIMIMPPGAFITLGLMMAGLRAVRR